VQVLAVVASSWPIAVMFIAVCVTGFALYVVDWFKRADREDKALLAAQVRAIATLPGDEQ
jgi:hypothetical protein